MTWIRTIPASEGDEQLRNALERQRALYPAEYEDPVPAAGAAGEGVVSAHSLIPDALLHAFATYGVLMSPDLPLARRQHEMIAAMVSLTNRCHY